MVYGCNGVWVDGLMDMGVGLVVRLLVWLCVWVSVVGTPGILRQNVGAVLRIGGPGL